MQSPNAICSGWVNLLEVKELFSGTIVHIAEEAGDVHPHHQQHNSSVRPQD
jgi:hypothetical protein